MKRTRKHLTVQDAEELNKLIDEWNAIAVDRRRQTFKVMMAKLVEINEKYEELDARRAQGTAVRSDGVVHGKRVSEKPHKAAASEE